MKVTKSTVILGSLYFFIQFGLTLKVDLYLFIVFTEEAEIICFEENDPFFYTIPHLYV